MPKETRNSEDEIQKAVKAYHERKNPKIAPLAREFSVSYSTLYARIHGRKTHSDRTDLTKTLNPIQEKALVSWVKLLDSSLIQPTPEEIESSANWLLQQAGASFTVGHNWVYRFIKRLPPNISYHTQKPKEKARMDSENLKSLSLWFYHFSTVIKQHEFLPHEIYNWDETGYQIGQGKPRKVVSSRITSIIATGGLAESITGIKCIAADGWVMLPWFLVKGSRQMEEWYTKISIPDFRIKPTPKGWVDDETAFEWLCCFHEATKDRIQKNRPRLLLMDNHPSHTTLEFTTYCTEKNIIPIWFLPHTTHLCQPLDGQAFQCLKHYFRKANNEVVMWGGSASQKRDFFRMIGNIRRDAFTQRTIRSSFSSRGIYPLDPEMILGPLRAQINDTPVLSIINTPSPPPELHSSATNSPPDTIIRVKKLNDKLLSDLTELTELSKRMQRYIRRSIDANLLLSQRLEICEASLKKSQSHKSVANTPKNRRSVLNAGPVALSPAMANRLIKRRQDTEDKKLQRQQAKHAKELELEQRAQLARDAAENEREARLAARDSGGANWYIDTTGVYR